LRLCFPEIADRLDFCNNLALPETGRLHVSYGFHGDPLLLLVRIEYRRTVACADIVSLAVPCRGIVNLEEIFQDAAVARLRCIEDNFDPLRMRAMVTVGCMRSVAAG